MSHVDRRNFLKNSGLLLAAGGALFLPSSQAEASGGNSKAAVSLEGLKITETYSWDGQLLGREQGQPRNIDYILRLHQDPAQQVLVRMKEQTAQERARAFEMYQYCFRDGRKEWRLGTDVFVFQGKADTSAPVNWCDSNPDDCRENIVERPGLLVDLYRYLPDGSLRFAYGFPTAIDCAPRRQLVIDTVKNQQEKPAEPKNVPTPAPERTPEPQGPKPAPVQLPRRTALTIEEEFGGVLIAQLAPGQVARAIYE